METYRNSQFMAGIVRWQDGWLSVCVNVENVRNFQEQLTSYILTASDIVNLVEGILY